MEPLEPAIEGLKSELSASCQIHRTAIAAEGQRMEEALATVEKELSAQRAEADRLRQNGLEVMSELKDADQALKALWRGDYLSYEWK